MCAKSDEGSDDATSFCTGLLLFSATFLKSRRSCSKLVPGRSCELYFADSHLFHGQHHVSVLLVDQHLAHALLQRTLQRIVVGQLDQALQWRQQRAGSHADVGHRVRSQGQNVIKEVLLEKCLGVEFDEVFAYDDEKTSAVTAAPMTKIWNQIK